MTERSRSLVVALIVIGIVALIAIAWNRVPWILAQNAYTYVIKNLRDATGWSEFLVRGLVLLFLLPFLWALQVVLRFDVIGKLRGLINQEKRRKNQRRQWIAHGLLIAYLAAYFLTMFAASRDNYFGYGEGEVRKYYAVTPEGVRWFDAPGFDPKYGIELKPATREIVANLARAERGLIPQRLIVKDAADIEFFNPLDGQPQVWYWEDADGEIELFSSSGRHPTYGDQLQPVTRQVVERIEGNLLAQQEARRKREEELRQQQMAAEASEARRAAQARLERLFNLSEASAETAVVIVRDGTIDTGLSQHAAEQLRATSSFFNPAFVSEGVFAGAHSGQTDQLRTLGLIPIPSRLVLGEATLREGEGEARKGMVRVEASVRLRQIDTSAGFRSTTREGLGIAARFTQAEARQDALQLALENALDIGGGSQ